MKAEVMTLPDWATLWEQSQRIELKDEQGTLRFHADHPEHGQMIALQAFPGSHVTVISRRSESAIRILLQSSENLRPSAHSETEPSEHPSL